MKAMRGGSTAGFALPSQSDRLPQPQTWPDPGGQIGDHAWLDDPAAAFSASPCAMPSCASTAGDRPTSKTAKRTSSALTPAILAGQVSGALRQFDAATG
jgi:hypothetical protein